MANLVEVQGQIKFQLQELSARNAHHEFEHICRHFSRRRVSPFILPATGPVSAKGDQQRDFETYPSQLNQDVSSVVRVFAQNESESLSFACSTEVVSGTAIKRKISKDVKGILGTGRSVDKIYFFSSRSIPVGVRHEIEGHIRDTHSIELVVVDAEAIAEALSDPDLFWIAQVYLHIPREIYPEEIEEKQSWYQQDLDGWQGRDLDPDSYSDFYSVKRMIRHATSKDSLSKDIPFLLEKLEKISSQNRDSARLRGLSWYEQIVARLRGLGSLEGFSQGISSFFSTTKEFSDTNMMCDRSIILSYVTSGSMIGSSDFDEDELMSIATEMLRKAEQQTPSPNDSPSTYCWLQDVRGRIEFSIASLSGLPKEEGSDILMKRWVKIGEYVHLAPLYPLSIFSQGINQAAVVVGNHPDYDGLTEVVDKALASRLGGYGAARACTDRAITFHNNGLTLRALREIHKAKSAWFSEESMGMFCNSLLMTAEWYMQLGLSLASKQYALAAAYAASNARDSRLVKRTWEAMDWLCNAQYIFGCFMEYVTFALASDAVRQLVPDGDISEEADLRSYQQFVIHASNVFDLLESHDAQTYSSLSAKLKDSGVEPMLTEARDELRRHNSGKSQEEIWKELRGVFRGHPTSDQGSERNVSWRALGITWDLAWKNEFDVSVLAEGWGAAFQILIAMLGGEDWFLLPTRVKIQLIPDDIASPKMTRVPNNSASEWKLQFPMHSENLTAAAISERTMVLIPPIMEVLAEVSLCPSDTLIEKMDDYFKSRHVEDIQIVRPYEDLYKNIIPEHWWFESERLAFRGVFPDSKLPLDEHDDLKWFAETLENYDEKSELESISRRYEFGIRACGNTFRFLRDDNRFVEVIRSLREKGWKDWHIFQAGSNLVINYHSGAFGESFSGPDAFAERLNTTREKFEAGADFAAIPSEYVTVEMMCRMLEGSFPPTLAGAGLKLRQSTPDLEAVSEFLRARCNYWSNDVDSPEAAEILPPPDPLQRNQR